ncbi:MAG: hypothetical protein AAFX04_00280 [Pseudomonadota bacterium]
MAEGGNGSKIAIVTALITAAGGIIVALIQTGAFGGKDDSANNADSSQTVAVAPPASSLDQPGTEPQPGTGTDASNAGAEAPEEDMGNIYGKGEALPLAELPPPPTNLAIDLSGLWIAETMGTRFAIEQDGSDFVILPLSMPNAVPLEGVIVGGTMQWQAPVVNGVANCQARLTPDGGFLRGQCVNTFGQASPVSLIRGDNY